MSNFTYSLLAFVCYICSRKNSCLFLISDISLPNLYIMKQLQKDPYGTPSIEVIEGLSAVPLCTSNTNGGNTEDLFFEDWQKLLGGGGVL